MPLCVVETKVVPSGVKHRLWDGSTPGGSSLTLDIDTRGTSISLSSCSNKIHKHAHFTIVSFLKYVNNKDIGK